MIGIDLAVLAGLAIANGFPLGNTTARHVIVDDLGGATSTT